MATKFIRRLWNAINRQPALEEAAVTEVEDFIAALPIDETTPVCAHGLRRCFICPREFEHLSQALKTDFGNFVTLFKHQPNDARTLVQMKERLEVILRTHVDRGHVTHDAWEPRITNDEGALAVQFIPKLTWPTKHGDSSWCECGQINRPGAETCKHCGESLQGSDILPHDAEVK